MIDKKIFISYRRTDSSGHAGRLYDYLAKYFGESSIFFDVDTIDPGFNFEQKIESELNNSRIVLVLIGNQWLELTDSNGNRRIDDPNDWVRLEIEKALTMKDVITIPVLLQGADMPHKSELPNNLHELALRNAMRLNDDHWESDFRLLIGVTEKAFGKSGSIQERKAKFFLRIAISLAVLGAFIAIFILAFSAYVPATIGLIFRILLITIFPLIIAIVTYLLGSFQEKMDQLSWAIVATAISGAILAALGGGFIIWTSLAAVMLAGLLNFAEFRESGQIKS